MTYFQYSEEGNRLDFYVQLYFYQFLDLGECANGIQTVSFPVHLM